MLEVCFVATLKNTIITTAMMAVIIILDAIMTTTVNLLGVIIVMEAEATEPIYRMTVIQMTLLRS